jgi:hypothetical protein
MPPDTPVLTEQLKDNLLALIRAGNYVPVACRAIGISRQVWDDWMRRGASEDPDYADYAALRLGVDRALASAEARNVAVIAQAATDNWQAAAWLLERVYPERYARASQREQAAAAAPLPPTDRDQFAEVDDLASARAARDR